MIDSAEIVDREYYSRLEEQVEVIHKGKTINNDKHKL